MRDLPALTGVSKEALAMATKLLEKGGLATVGADPGGGRWKIVRLTPKGTRARVAFEHRLTAGEDDWAAAIGKRRVARLRRALGALRGSDEGGRPLLLAATDAPEGTWRAKLPARQVLPRYPMVLHRGGYPDGA